MIILTKKQEKVSTLFYYVYGYIFYVVLALYLIKVYPKITEDIKELKNRKYLKKSKFYVTNYKSHKKCVNDLKKNTLKNAS